MEARSFGKIYNLLMLPVALIIREMPSSIFPCHSVNAQQEFTVQIKTLRIETKTILRVVCI